MEAALEARGLGKDYHGQPVLDDISLRIEPGCILGLIGRNGAGKTTLLRCLLGLLQPSRGEARIAGVPSLHLTDADKAALAYVPQQLDSFGWMSATAMLDFVAGLYPHWDRALAVRLLQRWSLDGERRLDLLSPGQRQQVGLIRALASRPRLLVLDEPAAALDPLARRELLGEIVDTAAEQGATVVFSSHILSDLERIVSHVALLDAGRLRLHAALDELKEEVRRVSLPAGVEPGLALPGELARHRREDGGWNLLLRLTQGQPPAGLPVQARLQPLGLEDLFVELAA